MRSPRCFALSVAALTLLSAGSALPGAPPSKSSKADYNRAQQVFEKAKRQYEAGKIAPALEGFRASFEIVESPITHLFEARALAALGRSVEAYEAFSATIEESESETKSDKRYQETRSAADEERQQLLPKIGLVAVKIRHAPDDATLKIAGKTIARAHWADDAAVAPGSLKVTLDAAGGLHAEATAKVAAGERAEVPITLSETPAASESAEPPPPPPEETSHHGPLRTAAFIAGGVGIAGIVTFAVAGSLAKSRFHDLQSSCGGPCPANRQSDIDGGKRMTTIANVGLGVGIVGVGASTVLFLLSSGDDSKPDATPPAAEISGGPGWVSVSGRF